MTAGPLGGPIPCLVIGFAHYTISLFSADLRQHLAFLPAELAGWDVPKDRLDLRAVTRDSLMTGIDAARETAGLEAVAVLGFSFGGMVAVDYALAYPKRVSQLVLVCSPPRWTASFRGVRQRFQDEELTAERRAILEANQAAYRARLPEIPAGQRFAAYTVVQAPLYWFDPHFDESKYWDGTSVNLDLVNHIDAVLYREHDQTKRFPELVAPVLAVFGRHDYAVPHGAWEAYKGLVPRLTMHVFPGSAHHPMVEEPESFDGLLLDWLTRTAQTDGT